MSWERKKAATGDLGWFVRIFGICLLLLFHFFCEELCHLFNIVPDLGQVETPVFFDHGLKRVVGIGTAEERRCSAIRALFLGQLEQGNARQMAFQSRILKIIIKDDQVELLRFDLCPTVDAVGRFDNRDLVFDDRRGDLKRKTMRFSLALVVVGDQNFIRHRKEGGKDRSSMRFYELFERKTNDRLMGHLSRRPCAPQYTSP